MPASAQARLSLALAAGKVAGTASKVLGVGGGTSFPGTVARRIDPRILSKVAAASDAGKVIVTGSNGKTTTCRMLAALARAGGLMVTQNRTGSNLLQGVTSAAVRGTNLRADGRGRFCLRLTKRRYGWWLKSAGCVPVTNIFRDQLDRFGELYSMAKGLETVIEALPRPPP
jgi:UDP-N-acetylmuramyl tripeptide synthase